jgi:2-keto-4-pentenoate hydratase
VLSRDGVEVERVAARGHIDDHFESLATLARELAKFDRGLKAGQRVITGSFTRQPVREPARWEADFGPLLGRVAIRFK